MAVPVNTVTDDEFLVHLDKKYVVADQLARIEEVFDVRLKFGVTVKEPEGVWVNLYGPERNRKEAKEYIKSLCHPEEVLTVPYPEELDSLITSPQVHRSLEQNSNAAIVFSVGNRAQVMGTSLAVVMAASALEDLVNRYKGSTTSSEDDQARIASCHSANSIKLDETLKSQLSKHGDLEYSCDEKMPDVVKRVILGWLADDEKGVEVEDDKMNIDDDVDIDLTQEEDKDNPLERTYSKDACQTKVVAPSKLPDTMRRRLNVDRKEKGSGIESQVVKSKDENETKNIQSSKMSAPRIKETQGKGVSNDKIKKQASGDSDFSINLIDLTSDSPVSARKKIPAGVANPPNYQDHFSRDVADSAPESPVAKEFAVEAEDTDYYNEMLSFAQKNGYEACEVSDVYVDFGTLLGPNEFLDALHQRRQEKNERAESPTEILKETMANVGIDSKGSGQSTALLYSNRGQRPPVRKICSGLKSSDVHKSSIKDRVNVSQSSPKITTPNENKFLAKSAIATDGNVRQKKIKSKMADIVDAEDDWVVVKPKKDVDIPHNSGSRSAFYIERVPSDTSATRNTKMDEISKNQLPARPVTHNSGSRSSFYVDKVPSNSNATTNTKICDVYKIPKLPQPNESKKHRRDEQRPVLQSMYDGDSKYARSPSPKRISLDGDSSQVDVLGNDSNTLARDFELSPSVHDARAGAGFGQTKLRYIVIDGSNVAMCHGNGKFFSCKGIALCVDYFLKRGHREITAFVPQYRRKAPSQTNNIRDQHILEELNERNYLTFTPSRRLEHRKKNIVCYDDRFIIKLAVETDGIIVSNDNYRDLMDESAKIKEKIENGLLMYSIVGDFFMPPDDPLGRNGPTLDEFLRKPDPRYQARISQHQQRRKQPPANTYQWNAQANIGMLALPNRNGLYNQQQSQAPLLNMAYRQTPGGQSMAAHKQNLYQTTGQMNRPSPASYPNLASHQASLARNNPIPGLNTKKANGGPQGSMREMGRVGEQVSGGRTKIETKTLRKELYLIFGENEERIEMILNNHPGEKDLNKLSTYLLDSM